MPSLSWKGRRATQAIWDGLSWVVAVPLAVLLRYDLNPPPGLMAWSFLIGAVAGLTYLIIGLLFRLYQGRYVVGSFDEVFGVALTAMFLGLAGTLVAALIPDNPFPRSAFIIATGIALISMLGARFLWRGAKEQSALKRTGSRTLIYGAGDAGAQIVNLMLADRKGPFQPIGFIDDDPSKAHLRRAGIRVLGTQEQLEDLITRYQVDILLVAIAGITAERLLDLDNRCRPLQVKVQVIPTATEIVGGAVKLGDISDVTDEDLLGRRPIQTDENQITDFIRGKRILVTGAGGSIGSELARQLSRYAPAQLTLLDRDESALLQVQLTLDGSGNPTSRDLVLADIRDEEALNAIFQENGPEIVFHAAALKHLSFLERFPAEAWKTNVLGTRNVLSAAQQASVDVFVNISTDKAADPTSVLGFSKRVTERITAGVEQEGTKTYVSVRFGNVLNSRGSVIETFRYQIQKGGPVTVTDQRMTRYFMTVSEAVHLVLQASVLGHHGETLVLDMGEQVPIIDVARQMIQRSGRDIDVVFTGIRPGEKLEEQLIDPHETSTRQRHPLISHCRVPPLTLPELAEVTAHDVTVGRMQHLARFQRGAAG